MISSSTKRTTRYLCHEVLAVGDIHISKVHVSFQKDVVFMPYVFFEKSTVIIFHRVSLWFSLK